MIQISVKSKIYQLCMLNFFFETMPLHTLPSSNTSSYFPLHPLTSSYLLLSSFGMVWLRGGSGVVTWDWMRLRWTFYLYIDLKDKSCGMGWWNPGTSSFLLHSLPVTSSHLLLIPPSYSTLLPNLLQIHPTSTPMMSDD